jgi:hypothetical protein
LYGSSPELEFLPIIEGVICGTSAVFDCLRDGAWLIFSEVAGGLGTRSDVGCTKKGLEAT